MKKHLLVSALASVFMAAPAFAASALNCSGNVMLGATDSGVTDRSVGEQCINDLILDTPNTWGSHGQFVSHVSKVTLGLQKQRVVTARERIAMMKAAAQSSVGKSVTVKLIAFNDFHGNIQAAPSNPGVARFATRINDLKAANPLNAVVSAGDMIGASPLISALFHDEPTIEAFNRIGIDFNAVGNHEFDEGKAELLRMQHGGNHPSDSNSGLGMNADLAGGEFAGAEFNFLAANVAETATGKTIFPGYGVKDFLGNKVAFIGMTLEGTPTIVTPAGVAGLTFSDEADTVNALVPVLKAKGIESIVVLVHEGGFAAGDINGCTGPSGPIIDIVSRLDAEVDLVITGHTHQAYNCLLNNKAGLPVRVTSGGQYARNLTDIDVTIDTRTRDVAAVVANNLITGTGSATAEDPNLVELVNHYNGQTTGPSSRVIGQIGATITRTNNAAGESVMGDVIADAQLGATDDVGFGEAVAAFMNPGGIRADLPFSAPGKVDGNVTYGEAFTVQPFGNSLVTVTLTGEQIDALLEQQFVGCTAALAPALFNYPVGDTGQSFNRILQVSNGFTYTWDNAGPGCQKVDIASIKINGVAINPADSYRVTVNSFIASGGDKFYVLVNGTAPLGGAQDLDALEAWFTEKGVIDPATYPNAQTRITRNN